MKDNSVFTIGNVLAVALGIAISIVFPVLLGYIRRDFVVTAGRLPPWVPKYARLAAFSFVTAVLVLAVYDSKSTKTHLTFSAALLLGFGWQSTVEKLVRPPIGVETKAPEAPTSGRSVDD